MVFLAGKVTVGGWDIWGYAGRGTMFLQRSGGGVPWYPESDRKLRCLGSRGLRVSLRVEEPAHWWGQLC